MQIVKAIALSAVFVAVLNTPAFSRSQSDQSQSDARSALGSELDALTRQYYASSDLVRPGIARTLARQLRASNSGSADASTLARAYLVVSQHAALDGRKDLALSTARVASGLAEPSGEKALQAQSSIAVTRALILQEEFVGAVRTISSARLAYGPMPENGDALWDELAMYEAISIAALPPRLQAMGASQALTADQRLALTGERGVRCGQTGASVVRIENVGLNPFANALNAMVDTVRGPAGQNLLSADNGFRNSPPVTASRAQSIAAIAVRSDLDEAGRVVRSDVTAYAPLQYFASAASRAAPTWQYRLPPTLEAACRNQILTVLAFKAR
jgi:hypothetical protein